MLGFTDPLAFAAVSLVAVLMMTTLFIAFKEAAQQRTIELDEATRALNAFYGAAERILDDKDTPRDVGELVATLVCFLGDRDTTERFTDLLCEDTANAPRGASFISKIAAIQKTRPDLVQDISMAVKSGVVAMFLRWPENAKKWHHFCATMAYAPKQENRIANRLVELRKLLKADEDGKSGMHNHSILA